MKEYLRVSELNDLIKDVLHDRFPHPVWVCGEIQGFDRNRAKNHIFFELIDKDPDSKNIIAKIGLVLFAGRKASIQDILRRSADAFTLKDDIEVKFACSIDFYAPHGAVRLIVESIDPTFTLGRLAQEKQKLIALLKDRGVLDKNKRLELPLVPLRLGLVTADDSAAYNDFYSELSRSGFAFEVYLHNALVQGKGAEKDVCKALKRLAGIEGLDAVVITRGGGSIADLSCFDSQVIAEAIADYPLPVLSGIGHEINLSVTDLAAHTYAKTPTAIAQFLVNRVQMFLDEIEEKMRAVAEGAQGILEAERQRLKDSAVSLQNRTRDYLKGHGEKIVRFEEVMRQGPAALLKDRRRALAELQSAVKRVAGAHLQQNRVKLTSYGRMIEHFHPVNTVKRGFSITRTADGKAVKSVTLLQPEDCLVTEVADGQITSAVTKIKNV